MIRFENITKTFPGVTALADVSFEIEAGTCHALLGENGAGKSTLGKILAGIDQPDHGRVLLDGQPVVLDSPRTAVAAGVSIVHQELVFCRNLSVAENLCLHDLPRRGWWLDRRTLRQRATELLARVGLDIDPAVPVGSLSIAQEQMVQIAAAVGCGARVVVFDEPTSSLGSDEVRNLFGLIRGLQDSGVTLVYVSHRLEEIFELCQAVTVLRDGQHVGTCPIGEVNQKTLVRMMVGRDLSEYLPQPPPAASAVRLRVEGLSSPGKFEDVGFEIHRGEIVGLAGLVGAGRTEVAAALFGLDPRATGTLHLDGDPIAIGSPRAALGQGVSLVPEDRKHQGLVLSLNVRENLSLPILERFRGWLGRVRRAPEEQLCREYCDRLAVRTPSLETATANLSGGNQQKIVLAKAVAAGGRVLLVDEPTRGVDVGAKQEIHELISSLARDGAAVLVISSDLPELLALAHRVVVLRAGRQVATLSHEQASAEAVLRAMAGLEEHTHRG